ncbi:MAG: hypothetical protein JNL39_00895 [Opitutaceae bacterium]|nr:hypothetical protein [Opitutaceae bacterium]
MSCRRHLLCLAAGLMLRVPAAEAAENRVVALPPFLVEEKSAALRWLYADVAGAEVLSSGSERLTRELIGNHHRLHTLLGELLPAELQFRTTEKQTLLFIDSRQQPATSQEVVARLALTSAEEDRLAEAAVPLNDGRLRRRPPPPRYSFLPNLRLWDRDTGILFAVVNEKEFDAKRLALTPDYVAYLLRNRLPALPAWFVSGVLALQARAEFTADALTLERLEWPLAPGAAALRADAQARRALLPLPDFFRGDLSASDAATAETLELWQAQAALLVHWGLGGRGAPRRAAFWRFVARAATEPVTEELFQECFGIDFAHAQQQLAKYLPEAVGEKLTLRPPQRPRLPDYALRPASDGEIARLKGDWERLEIGYVKAHFPALAPKYIEQARRTLRRAHDRGDRDPRLLAVMGLCEVDSGNDAAAREFLEAAATAGKTLRPRALLDLARLRLAAHRAARADAGGDLWITSAQADEVLAPLAAARDQEPPMPEIYELVAEVWAASADAPTRARFAVLEEGVRTFPRRTELVYRTASLSLRHGFAETARWVITLGLTLAPDPAARRRFEALQARLEGPE